MKLVPHSQSQLHASPVSEAREYPIDDKEIDCALVKIKGQYPGNDKFAVNTKSKELLFVVEGEGTVEIKNSEVRKFDQYDTILIEAGEPYRFTGNVSFCIVCTPPWSPEQCKNVD
ncbi:MAG: cupin domain-containing protein [Alphaproteobacteria bacterium]|nr:cupin domain-containing protein [Alphaproteobacteria bacterium]MCL2505187.1 cupin domain-containing protein [Alphaproteobacteria bacterium]